MRVRNRWAFVLLAFALALPVFAQESESTDDRSDADRAADVRQYIAVTGDSVGIACYPIDQSQFGVFTNADERFPLASTVKIMTLGVYARAVASGRFNPAERVPLDDLDAYYLPRTDGGAHPAFLDGVQPDANDTIALSEVVEGMIYFSSNAAADFLLARMVDADFQALYRLLGVENTDVPVSFLGLMLAQENHEIGISDADLPRDEVRAAALVWAEKYVTDPDWRAEERAYRRGGNARRYLQAGKSLIETQTAFFAVYDNEGTPGDFARAMAALVRDDVLPPRATAAMRAALSWPMRIEINRDRFVTLGKKGGSLPGTLTAAYYADPKEGDPIVLVVFYRDLPSERYLAWLRSYDQEVLEFDALLSGCGALRA